MRERKVLQFSWSYLCVDSHVTEEGKLFLPKAFRSHVMEKMFSLSHEVVVTLMDHAWIGYLHLKLRTYHHISCGEILMNKAIVG